MRIRLIILFAWSVAFVACSPATRIVVEWTTASEVSTAGFNLYRGENQAGPFSKVNAQLIPASNDPLGGGKYRYEDSNVIPGQTYYYQLEDVELSGTGARHGPIVITAPGGFSDAEMGLVGAAGLVTIGVLGWVVYFARQRRQAKS